MKFSKKFFAALLAAAMTVSALSGCGSADAKTFIIGGIGPITGVVSVYGIAVQRGAQIAIDEINAAGGVNGMTLALNFQDDEHNAEKSVNAYNAIKDAGAKVLMGTVTSTPCEAVVERTHADGMYQLTPSGSSINAVKYDNAFRICFSDPNQGTASAQYLSQLGYTKVAVIYDNSDVYSSGIYEKFAAEAGNVGIDIVSAQAFQGADNKDFNTQLIAISQENPEIVFLPIYYEAAALILQQAILQGIDTRFFGCDGLDGLVAQLGDDAAIADGVMLLTPFVADDPDEKVQAFVSKYKEQFKEVPNQFAADAYDAVYVIAEAIKAAGITDSTGSIKEIGDKLIAAMGSLQYDGLTGSMTWTADGECAKSPKGMVIENGEYTAIVK